MTALALARWQFAITTVYHFFFVPLPLGLSILFTIMETLHVRSGDAVYGLVGAVSVGMVGHSQAQHMFETQPMKMASAEACCCGPFPCPTGQHSRLDIGRGGPPTLDRVRLDADPACGVPILGAGTVLFSLLVSILIYGTLMVANVYLLAKFARKGATVATEAETPSDGESSAQPAPLQASISSLSSQTLDT